MNNQIIRALACSIVAGISLSACSQEATKADVPEKIASVPDTSQTTTTGYSNVEVGPEFNAADELLQPVDFRLWTYIGAPFTPNALNGGTANFPEYHNVYVQPDAFDHYRETGTWPEGTMMVKELQLAKTGDNFDDGSRQEVSGRGFFPAAVNGLDVSVKDSVRYAETNNWGYFNFGHHAPPYAASAPALPASACAQCHIDNADEDMVYTSFYEPILTPLPVSDERHGALADEFNPHVDEMGNITLPTDFASSWSHMGSWAVAKDGGVDGVHNVYAPQEVVAHYLETGEFADGAIMVKEVRGARGVAHTTGNAHWAEDVQVWFVMVKDKTNRFPDSPLWGDGWGWALFEGKDPSKQVATDYKKDCLGCHVPAKDTDWIYTYGYPLLGEQAANSAPQEEDAAVAVAAAMTEMATGSASICTLCCMP